MGNLNSYNRMTKSVELRFSIVLFALCVCGFILRLYTLTSGSIWLDEGYTILRAESGWLKNILLARSDANPPLPFILYGWWSSIAGTSELAWELPSVLAGVGGLLLIGYCGKILFNERVGLIAVFLVSVSVTHVLFSQQVRAYAMTWCVLLALIIVLQRYLQNGSNKNVWAVIVCGVSAVYLHYFAIFPVVGLLVGGIARSSDRKWSRILPVIFIFLVPMILLMLFPEEQFSTTAWIAPPHLKTVWDITLNFASKSIWLALLIAIIGLCNARHIYHEKTARWLLVGGLLLPTIAALLLSLFHVSVVSPRYFFLLYPAGYLLLAFSIDRIRSVLLKRAVIVVLGIGSIASLSDYYQGRFDSAVIKQVFRQIESSGIATTTPVVFQDKCGFLAAELYLPTYQHRTLLSDETRSNVLYFFKRELQSAMREIASDQSGNFSQFISVATPCDEGVIFSQLRHYLVDELQQYEPPKLLSNESAAVWTHVRDANTTVLRQGGD